MKQIGLKDYQSIKLPPEWDEPSVDDFWEMFWSKYDPKGELSDDDAETVRHWWYEFKGGSGCEWDEGIDTTLEEMKEELKDLYETRGVHSCETCERNCIPACKFIDWCRISHNDDYTMTDYWQKKMTIEDWKKKAEEYEKLAGYWHDKYYETKEESEKTSKLLGERCNQLLKDKGELTDQIADIKANCDYILEGKEIEYREERKKLCDDFENMKAGLESQIATLGERCNQLLKDKGNLTDKNKQLELIILGNQEEIAGLENQLDFIRDERNKFQEKCEDIELNYYCDRKGGCKVQELEQQIEKMKRHCNCKHRDSEGYCEVKRTYLIDLSYDGCDKWELED